MSIKDVRSSQGGGGLSSADILRTRGRAVMGINALFDNPLITELIFSLARYSVKLSVNVSGLTLTKLKY